MSQVIKIHPMEDFKERSRGVLNDPGQRKNFRGAMDFLQAKRRSQFPDQDELQGLRELGVVVLTDEVASIDTARKKVVLTKIADQSYDRLIVAPGVDFNFGAIQGLDAHVNLPVPDHGPNWIEFAPTWRRQQATETFRPNRP